MLKTVHAGLGTIGLQILHAVLEGEVGEPVAAADVAPELAGRTLADIMGEADAPDVTVAEDLEAALAAGVEAGAHVLVLATGSRLPAIADQIHAAIEHRLNVVSTSEELTWPWLRHPDLAEEIDAAAREAGVTVVGTGVNPGFLLDLLPLLLCRPCQPVRKITAKRIVNVSTRRPQLQEKVGSGLDAATYNALAERGEVGHVGLGESAAMLAAGLGWPHDDVYEFIEPVIAEQATGTEEYPVAAGQVAGSHQMARLATDDGRTIELICRMTHGEPDPRDEIIIDGDPWVRVRIEGGIFGDTATAGCTANILRQVVEGRPGLLAVKDLPVA